MTTTAFNPMFYVPDQIMALQNSFWNKTLTTLGWVPRERTIHQDTDNIGYWINA
ncbi:MAG: hypothetical protein QOJ19_3035 [Acidimicrobiia bacterium]|jgi:hypothetical protein|nr:hypothetical protein [Acidimicrobiia bacterium]